MDLRTDSGPVGRPGKKRPAKAAPKQRKAPLSLRKKLSLPDWRWPKLHIPLPSAELGLSGVLRSILVAVWHIPDRFHWLGPVSPFHRRWITVSAFVVVLGIVLPSGTTSQPERDAAALPTGVTPAAQDNTPVVLTPEALSERQPDRRIPQEMPEEMELNSEAIPVSSPPATQAVQGADNTARSSQPVERRNVTPPVADNQPATQPAVSAPPVRERVVKAPETKAPEKAPEKKSADTAVKTSTAGWQSYQVGKGVTLAQVFRSANLPLPDLMAMTRAQGANKPLSNVKVGQTVRVKTNAKGEVEALQLDEFAGSKPVIFVRLADGSFTQSQ